MLLQALAPALAPVDFNVSSMMGKGLLAPRDKTMAANTVKAFEQHHDRDILLSI